MHKKKVYYEPVNFFYHIYLLDGIKYWELKHKGREKNDIALHGIWSTKLLL